MLQRIMNRTTSTIDPAVAPAATPAPAIDPAAEPVGAPIGFREFVTMVAALMSLTALGIDSMLPALPAIADSLGVVQANAQQFVITAFVLGFGLAHLVHGPLVDRFGRRRVMLCALAGYIVANALAAMAGSFALLLAARVLGGTAAAAIRVAIVALVRDCYQGRAMARVMSIVFIVFMIVPVIAPAFGQAVLTLGDWRLIFWAIGGVAAVMFGWFGLRMPETLASPDRLPVALPRIVDGWRRAFADRMSLGYMLASAALLGGLYGYLNSVQQIMADTFGQPHLLGAVFAGTAATMAAANLLNARAVMRLGTRLISQTAMAVLILVAALHLALALAGHESLVMFGVLQAATMACFGLATANFSAMAMENMGPIAGTAASVQGFVGITAGTAIGVIVGQAFDGSTVPLAAGFLATGVAAFAIVAVTERGRLFVRG